VTHLALARDSLAFLCAVQGVATLAIDLSRTHATNPLWAAHARFHVVWQTANVTMLALLQLALILVAGPYQEQRFYLAAILASIPMFGFMAALISRKTFGGALSDPNGIQPLKLQVSGRTVRVDLNVAAVIGGLLALGAILAIYRG
jgi:hypothetical protein